MWFFLIFLDFFRIWQKFKKAALCVFCYHDHPAGGDGIGDGDQDDHRHRMGILAMKTMRLVVMTVCL